MRKPAIVAPSVAPCSTSMVTKVAKAINPDRRVQRMCMDALQKPQRRMHKPPVQID